ncbi:MAG: glutamine-hydrolyzing carbamoyl-phosphate synthase small subunit [Deltaproteobacteria bacterium]|nr:glutamine-hydrolyzing carbamoyl-phosphate synthase small subunit [Deltaproteobacteria bacterium]
MKRAYLALADGGLYEGTSFGFESETSGEVVFNTSLTGYQEILTDPSYCKQIVLLTYPMIGNYGVNLEDVESSKIQAAGLIVKEYCATPSNWRSTQTLSEYLKENKIVAVQGLPTREIVRRIRDKGAQPGILATGDWDTQELLRKAADLPSMAGQNLTPNVTCSAPYVVSPKDNPASYKIIAFDFGIKQNIVRELVARGCEVKVVPADTSAEDVLKEKPDGIFLSNGPGDPAACTEIIKNIQKMIPSNIPMFGICLGFQLLSLALGAKTFKLKFGHRGGNQPVKDLKSGRVLITAQNHGFAVHPESLISDMELTQLNLNDGTAEAFRHKKYPIEAVQYHPEAAPGPHDSNIFFDEFCERVKNAKTHRHS